MACRAFVCKFILGYVLDALVVLLALVVNLFVFWFPRAASIPKLLGELLDRTQRP